MEIRDKLSDDSVAGVTVKAGPLLETATLGDGDGGVPDPETSCIPSNNSSVNCSGTSSKKNVDREMRQPFPVKVYEMLENAEIQKFDNIVSWNEAGTGFMVHDKDNFTKEIVPHYFNLTKYKSFQRQLSLYGFQRVTVGPNKGLRYHEKLRKGKIELVRQMKPVGYKPRNLTRLLEQKKQQQLERATNILTTTTTTVVKTTTTSTTLVANHPSKDTPNTILTATNAIIDAPPSRNVNMATILCKSQLFDTSTTRIPPVVSSSSLIRQEDHEATTIELKKQQFEQQNIQLHSISPETTHRNPIHLANNEGSDIDAGNIYSDSRSVRQHRVEQQNSMHVRSEAEPEIVIFEGMCFFLMSPARELGINVKLKLLEEFNPTSNLLRIASKYVTCGYTAKSQTNHSATSVPEKIPITIDTVQDNRPSLLEPFTDIISTAAATSTASTIAALQAALANSTALNSEPISTPRPLLSATISNTALETRCMDPFDFHSMDVAKSI